MVVILEQGQKKKSLEDNKKPLLQLKNLLEKS